MTRGSDRDERGAGEPAGRGQQEFILAALQNHAFGRLGARQLRVLFALIALADFTTGQFRSGASRISQLTDLDHSCVRRALRELTALGFVSVIEDRGNGRAPIRRLATRVTTDPGQERPGSQQTRVTTDPPPGALVTRDPGHESPDIQDAQDTSKGGRSAATRFDWKGFRSRWNAEVVAPVNESLPAGVGAMPEVRGAISEKRRARVRAALRGRTVDELLELVRDGLRPLKNHMRDATGVSWANLDSVLAETKLERLVEGCYREPTCAVGPKQSAVVDFDKELADDARLAEEARLRARERSAVGA